jgi:guanylate kinase
LIERLRSILPDLEYSISCSTRRPRKGEIDGESYYFLSREEFLKQVEKNRFLEWKEVHGNLYGTPRGPVEDALASGRRMILDLDVQGAKEIFKGLKGAVGIFITAPDLGTIEQRLRSRGTETEENIRIRLENAREEMTHAVEFDHVVQNDDLERAAMELARIIEMESNM